MAKANSTSGYPCDNTTSMYQCKVLLDTNGVNHLPCATSTKFGLRRNTYAWKGFDGELVFPKVRKETCAENQEISQERKIRTWKPEGTEKITVELPNRVRDTGIEE